MKTSNNRARRSALSLSLISAVAMMAAPAFAGTCADKTSKAASMSTATMHNAPAQIVLAAHHSEKPMTIVDRAMKTESLSTLVAAVKAAGLVDTLAGPGPFTVFAPTNKAFDGLPEGLVADLLEPENKDALTSILTAHVVAGNLSAADIIGLAKANGGTVDVKTLSGDTLTAVYAGDMLYVKDEKGGLASVKKADIKQSNGTVHVVSRVLLPQ